MFPRFVYRWNYAHPLELQYTKYCRAFTLLHKGPQPLSGHYLAVLHDPQVGDLIQPMIRSLHKGLCCHQPHFPAPALPKDAVISVMMIMVVCSRSVKLCRGIVTFQAQIVA